MRIELVSFLISTIVSAALGGAALLRNFRSRLCLSFSVLCAILMTHDIMSVLDVFDSASGSRGLRIHLAIILALGPVALWFLTQIVPSYRKSLVRISFVLFVFVLGCLAFTYLPIFGLFSAYAVSFSHAIFVFPAGVVAYVLQDAAQKVSLTRERLRLRYAFWGAAITIALFLTNSLYWIGVPVPPLGTFGRTLYLLFIFQIFVQKEFIRAEEVVARVALFGLLATIVSVIYALMLSWVGVGREMFFFNTLITSLVIIILFDPIRSLTMKWTRRFFLRVSSQLEEELRHLSGDILGLLEPAELLRCLRLTLKRSLGIEVASLYLLDRDELTFYRVAASADSPSDEISVSIPLIEYMSLRRGRPFVLETIETDRDCFHSLQPIKFCESCLENMRQLQSDLVLPFFLDGKVVGFCAAQTGEKILLSNDQLRLFVPVLRQIAGMLKNAQAFSRIKDRDKLRAVGEMAAGLAHEIKNPLGAIRGAAELLQPENAQGKEVTQIIVDEADRLSKVLTDFLDYAKPRSIQPQTGCDPVKVIEHTANLVLRDRPVQFELDCQSSLIYLDADPDALKQVLLNLFLNALQAMDGENGKLVVRVREIHPRRQLFRTQPLPRYKAWEGWDSPVTNQRYPYLEIAVEDNGRGIRDEDRARVFVPFFTTRHQGTGLGLAICQRLVEGMEGTIHLKPNSPRGSVFTIHLPLHATQSSHSVAATPKDLPI